jgi:hypothetical protein
MIILMDSTGQPTWGDDHNHLNNAHFNSDLHGNDPHQHDWNHDFHDHAAHAHELPNDPHALDSHAHHGLDTQEHHLLDAHAPLKHDAPHSYSLVEELQKFFVGAEQTAHDAHAMSFGATYTKSGQDVPAIVQNSDDILCRRQHDGSTVELFKPVRNGTDILLCDKDFHGLSYNASDSMICRIDQNGNVYTSILNSGYIGKMQEGKMYNADGHFIGYADTPAQAAAHIYFLRA